MHWRFFFDSKTLVLDAPNGQQRDLTFTLFAYGFQLVDKLINHPLIRCYKAIARPWNRHVTRACDATNPASKRGSSRINILVNPRSAFQSHAVPVTVGLPPICSK